MAPRFRQYQAFHAIIETGTVTGAAEALGISQPGISNLISQLERQTKLKLFERQRGRLMPTPEAAVLYQEVDTVVRGLDHVSQAVVDLRVPVPRCRIRPGPREPGPSAPVQDVDGPFPDRGIEAIPWPCPHPQGNVSGCVVLPDNPLLPSLVET